MNYFFAYRLLQGSSFILLLLQSTHVLRDFRITEFGVIQDNQNGLVYLLGGDKHERDIHRINVSNQSMTKINISLPSPGIKQRTTILSKQTGMIYVFRGLGVDDDKSKFDHDQIAFTQRQHLIIDDNITTTNHMYTSTENKQINQLI